VGAEMVKGSISILYAILKVKKVKAKQGALTLSGTEKDKQGVKTGRLVKK
jgi:hypothetical protein